MKYILTLTTIFQSTVLLVGCGTLKSPIINQNEPVRSYAYFYITQQQNVVVGFKEANM